MRTLHEKELAVEALVATRSAWVHWRDEAYGESWAAVLGGESDDPLTRANQETALARLAEYVDAGEVEDGTVSKSGYPWVAFVGVHVIDEETGEPTRAWRATVEQVLDPLADCPVLDEDRMFELEHEALAEAVELEYGTGELRDLALEHLSAAGVWNTEDFDAERTAVSVGRDLFVRGVEVSTELAGDLVEALTRAADRLSLRYLPAPRLRLRYQPWRRVSEAVDGLVAAALVGYYEGRLVA
jgi:hypothetical protein